MKGLPTGVKSLAFKLALFIFLINIFVFTALGVYYSCRFGEHIERQLASQSEIPGILMTESSLNYSMVRDTDALGRLIGGTVDEAMVIMDSGRILYSSTRELEGEKLWHINPDSPVFDQLIDRGGEVGILQSIVRTGHTRNVVTPLYAHGTLSGYLWMSVNIDEDMLLKRQVTLIFFIGTLACILVSGFGQIFFINRLVVPRIRRTVSCLHLVQRGNLSARIQDEISDDEIGMLEYSVNTMVAEIESRSEAMRRSANDLEIAKEEAERARVAAEQASAAKSEFLANTSHEIRTPLNGILGMSELLYDSELSDEHREQVKIILNSGEVLLGIINNILDLSCVESGRMELPLEPLDIALFFRDLEEAFIPFQASTGIPLVIVLDKDLPRCIHGAQGPMRQILTNLIANAYKFTEQGEIRLSAHLKAVDEEKQQCEILFSVEDSGIGIAKEDCSKIFEAFTQADGSSTRRHGGTGLGLTISSEMVSKLDGELSVESEEGKGSKFFFTLPLAYMDEMPKEELEESFKDDPSALSGRRVLVVEDNKVNRLLIKTFLQREGVEVVEAVNGQEALTVLGLDDHASEPVHFDSVLMDVQMPVLDGLETTRIIREREKIPNAMPIIACTAHAMRGDKEKFIEAGMNDYISKPIRKPDLMKILSHYIMNEIAA